MKSRKLGAELSVFPVGLGCMGMTHAYGGQDEADAIRTLHRAVELGVTLFDTAEVYGPFTNEVLVGKAFKPMRDKVKIATKFGFNIAETIDGPKQQVWPEQPAGACQRRRRSLAAAAGHRRHRPLLPAPRRSRGADRGYGRRHGRSGSGGQGAHARPVGGERRHHPPRACGASDRRRPERIFAVDARPGKRTCSPSAASSASASCRSARSAAASSPAPSSRRTSSARTIAAAACRASRPTTSGAIWPLSRSSRNWRPTRA